VRQANDDRGTLRRAAFAVVLILAATPAFCPEEPLLGSIDEARLRPYLESSRDEIAALLARHRARRPPRDLDLIAGAVGEATRLNGIPPELVLAVIGAESSFRQDAISDKGAVGLMQLMPFTARQLASELRMEWTDEELLLDPQANIAMGSRYLGQLLASFDDLDNSLAAYNRGPTAVRTDGWPRGGGETAGFVRRVKDLLAREGAIGSPRSFGEPRSPRAPGDSSL
jgi:soluble lytic murein transglycosylase-like protein